MAFETLTAIAEQLNAQVGMDEIWVQNIIKRLEKAKQYLKTDYKANYQAAESRCADLCRPFALSDPDAEDFQTKCNHQHLLICESCEELKTTLMELETSIKEHFQSSFTHDH